MRFFRILSSHIPHFHEEDIATLYLLFYSKYVNVHFKRQATWYHSDYDIAMLLSS